MVRNDTPRPRYSLIFRLSRMSIKTYQPGRKDLLINTDWGLPQEQLTESQARERALSLFHGRWVSKDEQRQLRDEANAYRSIRSLAGLLLFLSFLSFVLLIPAMNNLGSSGLLVVIPGAAFLVSGIGLRRYARWGRDLAAVLFALMLAIPFIPAGSDDKGGPFFLFIGIIGLYYLFRKTASRIFKGGN